MKESKKRRLSLLNDAMFFIVKILHKVTHPNEGFWKKVPRPGIEPMTMFRRVKQGLTAEPTS